MLDQLLASGASPQLIDEVLIAAQSYDFQGEITITSQPGIAEVTGPQLC